MKKMLCILVLAAGLGTAVSAQNFAIGVDAMPLFKGLIWTDNDNDNGLFALSPYFEYRVAPNISLGAAVDLWIGERAKIDVLYFALAGQARWYPLSSGVDKLFLGALVGFNMFSVDGEDADAEHGGMSGFAAALKAGWKILFGPSFFVEPSMSYGYAKSVSGSFPGVIGWQAGLTIGGAF